MQKILAVMLSYNDSVNDGEVNYVVKHVNTYINWKQEIQIRNKMKSWGIVRFGCPLPGDGIWAISSSDASVTSRIPPCDQCP